MDPITNANSPKSLIYLQISNHQDSSGPEVLHTTNIFAEHRQHPSTSIPILGQVLLSIRSLER